MDIYILDQDLNVIGVFGVYRAVIWHTKMYEPGKFKAEFTFSEMLNRKLERGNFLYKTDEAEPGIITKKTLKLSKSGEQTIQVQGYMASYCLARRIVWNKMILNGTPEDAMRRMVYEQAIAPANPDRVLPRLRLGEKCGYPGSIEKQVIYDNLQEALTDIGKQYELGYRLRADLADKLLYFEVYKGADRTLGSRQPCIFSRDYLNVLTQEYYEDDSNCYNVCLVGGTGDDTDRILASVGDSAGLSRSEMFYNASGLSDKVITQAEYLEQLRQSGAERLRRYALVQSFENNINPRKAMVYSLGDYVTCTDNSWGIVINAQIAEIEMGYSMREESCLITLGNKAFTLAGLIKAGR